MEGWEYLMKIISVEINISFHIFKYLIQIQFYKNHLILYYKKEILVSYLNNLSGEIYATWMLLQTKENVDA